MKKLILLRNILFLILLINFSDDVLLFIINNYTKESGVRDLGRILKRIIRNYCLEKRTDKKISLKDVKDILGEVKYINQEIENHNGVVNSLAWTINGGNIQKIECVSFDGTGKNIRREYCCCKKLY